MQFLVIFIVVGGRSSHRRCVLGIFRYAKMCPFELSWYTNGSKDLKRLPTMCPFGRLWELSCYANGSKGYLECILLPSPPSPLPPKVDQKDTFWVTF